MYSASMDERATESCFLQVTSFFTRNIRVCGCGDSNSWPPASRVASSPSHLQNTSDWVMLSSYSNSWETL
jgi:hypothetical protein